MYRCTDCSQVYKEKPEYCDCGNNVFEEIPDIEELSNFQFDFEQNLNYQDEDKFEPDSEKVISNKNNDLPSVLIFIFCIILSICSFIFIGKDNKEDNKSNVDNKNQQVSVSKKTVDIPQIDEIWKENPNKTVSEKELSRNDVNVSENTSEKTPVTQNVTGVQKQDNKPKTVIAKNNPSNNTINTNVSNKPVVKKQTVNKTASTVTKPKTVDYAAAKKELLNYKIALRNKMAANVNFASIVGDGNCVVTFKIDNSGKLIDRKFTKLSQNDSVNDAVYAAVMQIPAYNPPPVAYKGETLSFSFKMYGGNFEIDLR